MSGYGAFLEKILDVKRLEVERLKREISPDEQRRRAADAPPARDFLAALRSRIPVPVIAEIKKASPSAGPLKQGVDVAAMARDYQAGGAAALSVLTDSQFFAGCMDDLTRARNAVEIPVLRKDFIIDPAQVYQARIAGADAVLLIAAAFSHESLDVLIKETMALGMTPLVEVHDERELDAIREFHPPLVGINNRNLRTFEVSLETCLRLRKRVEHGTFVIGESGIRGPEDIRRLHSGGIDGFLIGTTLMTSPDSKAELLRLCRAVERT